ncbi:MAG: DDE-type integrase/transposase/recombinase [Anaerolineales bacterium]|nr:DDE-type integrase/transposase/recombinase [Anaerolineales bacterium]
MSAQRLLMGTQFYWRDRLYEVQRLLPAGQVSVECLFTGVVETLETQTLVAALFSGEMQFVVEHRAVQGRGAEPGKGRRQPLDLTDYPEHLVAMARYRLEVIQPLLALASSQRTRQVIQNRIQEVRAKHARPSGRRAPLSRASISRWIRAYEQSGGDLRALIPAYDRCGGPDQSRLAPELVNLVNAMIREADARPEKVTVTDLRYWVAAQVEEENKLRPATEHLHLPSEAAIARRMAALDLAERLRLKRGKRAAQREFTQSGQMDYPRLPLARVEIDHTRIDLIVIDENDRLPLGRPTLTYCLDTATRYPLGYYLGFEPPSYYTVMECLHHAICPKENVRQTYGTEHDWVAHGIPSMLVVDNGKEFIRQDLTDACELLGIVLQQCPLMSPEFKAGVERQFGTLNTGVFHTLPGTTFSNVFERGDYDSRKQACLALSEVEKALTIFIVDLYAERKQRELEGIPARAWEQARAAHFVPRLPASREELAILLGRVEGRVIHHYGIDFECLRYNTPDLGTLRVRLKGEKAKLKYHPGDLSRLDVFDPFEKRYLEVPALDQAYTAGLSLWKHRVIRRFAALEAEPVDLAALGRAKRKIQDVVEMALSRKGRRAGRTLARWQTGGQPPSLATGAPIMAAPMPTQPALSPPSAAYDDALLTTPPAEEADWGLRYRLPNIQGPAPLTAHPEAGAP